MARNAMSLGWGIVIVRTSFRFSVVSGQKRQRHGTPRRRRVRRERIDGVNGNNGNGTAHRKGAESAEDWSEEADSRERVPPLRRLCVLCVFAVPLKRKDVQVQGCKAMWDIELRRSSDFGRLGNMDFRQRREGHKVKQHNRIGDWPRSPDVTIRVRRRPETSPHAATSRQGACAVFDWNSGAGRGTLSAVSSQEKWAASPVAARAGCVTTRGFQHRERHA